MKKIAFYFVCNNATTVKKKLSYGFLLIFTRGSDE